MNSQGWAMRLDRRDVAAAGRLRQVAGVEVCEQPEAVWLRGPQSGEELQWQLAAVAGARRFSVLPDGQLLPCGARVPQGWLPQGPWTALVRWMGLEPPPARLAGRGDATVSPALVRSDRMEEASLLLTRFDLWAAYAIEAPQVRLDRWRFAVAADGRVAVHGHLNRDRLQTYPTPCRRCRASVGSSGKALPCPPAGPGRPPSKPRSCGRSLGLPRATWRYGMRMERGSGLRPRSSCGPRGPR